MLKERCFLSKGCPAAPIMNPSETLFIQQEAGTSGEVPASCFLHYRFRRRIGRKNSGFSETVSVI